MKLKLVFALFLGLVGCGGSDDAQALELGEAGVGVRINNHAVSAEELERLEARLLADVPPGHYWYDARSGLGGPWGSSARVYAPGFDFGPVPANASGGNTGIFYNGRELSWPEAQYIAAILGVPEAAIPQFVGRYVLESNGDLYTEAGQYLGNLAAMAAARAPSGGGSGGCTAVRIPSSAPNPTGVPQTIDVATGTDC